MQVPLLNLKAQYAPLRDEMRDAILEVMDSQLFVLGNQVKALESSVAQYSQAKYAVGCASGSDALLLALMALDVKSDDEVITTPFSFFATASAITRTGASPVFVDIDPDTYNLDASQLEDAITSRTKAILPVHIYGQCAEMDPILDIAMRHDLPVIEDAAQAIGAEDQGRRAGSMGLAGCFSFYPTKNLGGAGDGGILTTSDERFAERLRRLRTHGGLTEYEHIEIGLNSRLDELQAAVLNVKMKYLDGWSNRRASLSANYTQLLTNAKISFEVVPPVVREEGRHIFHQYVIRVPNHRDSLMLHLKECRVGTKVYYPIPLHRQPCFQYLGKKEGAFPETELAARETLALPMFPELTEEQQVYVVDSIKSFKP
ncbi:MAG: transcriptional regulator [Blastocatellia bacterium]|nr:MAG: transcriptional regulator [Blastocatellia bacterium]